MGISKANIYSEVEIYPTFSILKEIEENLFSSQPELRICSVKVKDPLEYIPTQKPDDSSCRVKFGKVNSS